MLPLPLIRFGINTKWFASSFDFITGPNLDFTIAPGGKIRLTGEMRMDNYRSIEDLVCEFTLWYRLFGTDHRLGDIAGVGIGFKNDLTDFSLSSGTNLSGDITVAKTFELRQTAVFAVFDLSLIKIQAGWIFDSAYLLDDKKSGSPGTGFFIAIQGIIPVTKK